MLEIPNVPAPEVPDGADESDNLQISAWGQPKDFNWEVKDHVALGEQPTAGTGFCQRGQAYRLPVRGHAWPDSATTSGIGAVHARYPYG